MKKNIFTFAFMTFCFFSYAQVDFIIEPNPNTVVKTDADLTDNWLDIIAHSILINNSNQDVSIKWEKVPINCEQAHEVAVCDNNQCYSTDVTSNINPMGPGPNVPVLLGPGDTSIIDVHMYPRTKEGCCEVQVHVSLELLPGNILATGQFYFDINSDVSCGFPVSVIEINPAPFSIAPNPVQDVFSISGIDAEVAQVNVFNTLGSVVLSMQANDTETYNVSALPAGMYVVGLHDAEGTMVGRQKLVKQ